MRKKLERLSAALGNLLSARGMQGRLSEYRILGQWEKTVGVVIAGHARPATVRGSKLFLVVDSPAWMQQLSLLKPEIIDKVNRGLGRQAIKDIVLNIGDVEAGQKRSRDVPRAPVELNSEEHAQIDRYIKDVQDPELRGVLRRVIEKDFLSKRPSRK
jgi:predicted nucleic acid-binding Zn ribbon protein